MDTKKFLMGTVAGGVAYFILGFLIYGLALAGVMAQYTNAACMRPMEEMIYGTLIAGNLGYAAILTYVFLKAGNINSFGSGAQTAAVISFLMCLTINLMNYTFTTLVTDVTPMAIDVVAATVLGGLAGGVIGMVLGMGNKPPAA